MMEKDKEISPEERARVAQMMRKFHSRMKSENGMRPDTREPEPKLTPEQELSALVGKPIEATRTQCQPGQAIRHQLEREE